MFDLPTFIKLFIKFAIKINSLAHYAKGTLPLLKATTGLCILF